MRIAKLLTLVAALVLVSGCTCRSKKVGPEEVQIPPAVAGVEVKDINFAFDSAELDATARAMLNDNAKWLKDHPTAKAQIEGHCDERGTRQYNMVLGQKRAQSAFDYLRSLGIEAGRLSTVSYGKELPLDPRHNEEAWAKNRRDHFNLQK